MPARYNGPERRSGKPGRRPKDLEKTIGRFDPPTERLAGRRIGFRPLKDSDIGRSLEPEWVERFRALKAEEIAKMQPYMHTVEQREFLQGLSQKGLRIFSNASKPFAVQGAFTKGGVKYIIELDLKTGRLSWASTRRTGAADRRRQW